MRHILYIHIRPLGDQFHQSFLGHSLYVQLKTQVGRTVINIKIFILGISSIGSPSDQLNTLVGQTVRNIRHISSHPLGEQFQQTVSLSS